MSAIVVSLAIGLVIWGFIAYAAADRTSPSRWRRSLNVVSGTIHLFAVATAGMAAIGLGFLLISWILQR